MHGMTSSKSPRTTCGLVQRQTSALATEQEQTWDHDFELTAEGLRLATFAAAERQRQKKCKDKYIFASEVRKGEGKGSKVQSVSRGSCCGAGVVEVKAITKGNCQVTIVKANLDRNRLQPLGKISRDLDDMFNRGANALEQTGFCVGRGVVTKGITGYL